MTNRESWQAPKRWCPNAFIGAFHDGRAYARQAENAAEHIAVLYGDGAILAAYVRSASEFAARKGGRNG